MQIFIRNKKIMVTRIIYAFLFVAILIAVLHVLYEIFHTSPEDQHKLSRLERRFPKALIIGAKKCGTRALLEFLSLHPHIEICQKELSFFHPKNIATKGIDWYKQQMPLSYDYQITIEKTPRYFVSSISTRLIHAFNQSIKLILIVREPSKRTLSDYVQTYILNNKDKAPPNPFEKTVLSDTGEVNTEEQIIWVSYYYRHMQRWLNIFPRKQILVLDGEKLVLNPVPELQKVETFLNIPPYFSESHFYVDSNKTFYCMRTDDGNRCLSETKGVPHPSVDPQVLAKLRQHFEPYNEKFFKLIGERFNW